MDPEVNFDNCDISESIKEDIQAMKVERDELHCQLSQLQFELEIAELKRFCNRG